MSANKSYNTSMNPNQINCVSSCVATKTPQKKGIARILNVHRSTLSRLVKRLKDTVTVDGGSFLIHLREFGLKPYYVGLPLTSCRRQVRL